MVSDDTGSVCLGKVLLYCCLETQNTEPKSNIRPHHLIPAIYLRSYFQAPFHGHVKKKVFIEPYAVL